VVETLRIAPSMVAHRWLHTYVVAQTDTEGMPVGDRVDDAIAAKIV
jgi:hypothetical protein